MLLNRIPGNTVRRKKSEVPLTKWQFTENTLGVLIQPRVRENCEIPSKTGALALHDKRNHALINAIICLLEIENGNHQKLVSSSVCLRDDSVHPVDLALAAHKSNLPGAAWRGVWEQSCLGAGAAGDYLDFLASISFRRLISLGSVSWSYTSRTAASSVFADSRWRRGEL